MIKYLKIVAVFVLLSIHLTAIAVVDLENMTKAEADAFYLKEVLAELKKGFYPISDGSKCTGTQISKAGHILLARHCIESPIYEAEIKWVEEQLGRIAPKWKAFARPLFDVPLDIVEQLVPRYFERTKFGSQDEYRTAEFEIDQFFSNQIRSLKFSMKILSTKLYSDAEVPVSITSTSPGTVWPRFVGELKDRKWSTAHNHLSDQGYSTGGDFAIIKIDALKNQRCHRLSSESLQSTEKLTRVSFDCFKGQRGTEWPYNVQENIFDIAESKGKYLQNGFYLANGNFITNTEAFPCNSGSPIFNEKKEIAGVLHTVTDFKENKKSVSRSVYISTKRIFELMGAQLKDQIQKLNKDCETNTHLSR